VKERGNSHEVESFFHWTFGREKKIRADILDRAIFAPLTVWCAGVVDWFGLCSRRLLVVL
jgi:hypothetical protein